MPFRERHYRSSDDLRLYFRDYGDPAADATPILCLTGLTRNSKDFHGLAERLSTRRRVICPDYRGRGRSHYDSDPRNYRPPVYMRDVAHLLAVTGAHRVVVIGTSLGGLLAMGLAAMMPTALAGVVLNDIGPDINPAGLQAIVEYIRTDRPQPDWESAIRFIRTMLPKLTFRDDGVWRQLAENTFRQGDDGLLHFDWDVRLVEPLLAPPEPMPDLWALYRGLARIPTLAIRGGESEILTARCFDRMAEERPDLRRLTVAGTGHTPTLSEPEVKAALDEFLSPL
ncbi:MAG: alpha/beta hydrolase [Alphaproteobacteria bacterium]|nr:alpha/beta hydrolase [Alphaproteobacteria bacterium]